MDTALPDGLRGRLLALALTVVVIVVAWLACVQPLLEWHAARAEALDQRSLLLQRMTALVATLPELERQSSGEHAPTAALLEGASDAIAGAALQSAVQGMATTAGAELNSMEMLPAEQRGAYHRIGLRVATAAPWPVLIDLLRQIEQGMPRMLIDDVQLRAPPVELRAAASPISAAFTIVAFRTAASGAKE
ncbi:MAG TPA: type II secretion system protein GspM [Acetobacteraceae bacterium]|jgi:general secretion pathway protein M|nr:type II secretion system protein GspM [Acetobacteraceae bacterium]